VLAVLGLGAGLWQPWRSPEPALSATDRVLGAPDAVQVSMDLSNGARATIVRSVSERRAVLRTESMAPAPDGMVYELWLQGPDGTMAPAGLMPDAADQTVLLDGDAATAIAAGITVEPAGGSEQPTSDPIALFDFTEAT
jgi:anti-sigma-K factor RskA